MLKLCSLTVYYVDIHKNDSFLRDETSWRSAAALMFKQIGPDCSFKAVKLYEIYTVRFGR